AGFETAEAIAAVPAALDLAAAGGIGLGRAADIASNAIGAFGLAAEEASRVADVFAATAARSNTDVEQLAQALTTVGPIANSVGLTIEQTAASIGVLGDSGIQASVAGTGLRGVLASLADPSDALAAALGEVSLQSDGLDGVLEALAARGVSAGEAFEFFGREAAPAFQVLLQGRDRASELSTELGVLDGEARRLAEEALGPLDRIGRTLSSVFSELTLQLGDSGLAEAALIASESLLEFARSEAAADAVQLLGAAILGATTAIRDFLNFASPFLSFLGSAVSAVNDFVQGVEEVSPELADANAALETARQRYAEVAGATAAGTQQLSANTQALQLNAQAALIAAEAQVAATEARRAGAEVDRALIELGNRQIELDRAREESGRNRRSEVGRLERAIADLNRTVVDGSARQAEFAEAADLARTEAGRLFIQAQDLADASTEVSVEIGVVTTGLDSLGGSAGAATVQAKGLTDELKELQRVGEATFLTAVNGRPSDNTLFRQFEREFEGLTRAADRETQSAADTIDFNLTSAFDSILRDGGNFVDDLAALFGGLAGSLEQQLAPVTGLLNQALNFDLIGPSPAFSAGLRGNATLGGVSINATPGVSVGDALGGAASGFGIGSILGGGTTSSQVGGAVLGGAGSIVGGLSSVAGAIGGTAASLLGPIGGIVGSLLGGLIGGAFGPPPPNNAAGTRFDPLTGAILSQGGPKSPSPENIAASGEIGQQSVDIFRALVAATGASPTIGGIAGDVSDRDGSKLRFTGLEQTEAGDRFDFASADTPEEVASATLRAFLDIADDIGGEASRVLSDVLGDADPLARGFKGDANLVEAGEIDPALLERATEALSIFNSTAEALADTGTTLGPIEQNLNAITEAAEANRNALAEFGLSIDGVNQLEQRRIDELRQSVTDADAALVRELEGRGFNDAAASLINNFSAQINDRAASGIDTTLLTRAFTLQFEQSIAGLDLDQLLDLQGTLGGLVDESAEATQAFGLIEEAIREAEAAADGGAEAIGEVGDALVALQAQVREALQDFGFGVTERTQGTGAAQDAQLAALGLDGLSLSAIRGAESVEEAQAALLSFQGTLEALGSTARAEGDAQRIAQAGQLALAAYDESFARLGETVTENVSSAESEFDRLFTSISASLTSSVSDITSEIERSTDALLAEINRQYDAQIRDLQAQANAFGQAAGQAGSALAGLQSVGISPQQNFDDLLAQFDGFAAQARTGSASGVSGFASFQGDFLDAVRDFFPEGTAEFDEQLGRVRDVLEESQNAALERQQAAEQRIEELLAEQQEQNEKILEAAERQIETIERAAASSDALSERIAVLITSGNTQTRETGATLTAQQQRSLENDATAETLLRQLIDETRQTGDAVASLRSALR
ncbi:MAG: phage tail tape measure protein, partial [Pseudomonadota bacterium]